MVLGTGPIEASVRKASLQGLDPKVRNLFLRRLMVLGLLLLRNQANLCNKELVTGMKGSSRMEEEDEVGTIDRKSRVLCTSLLTDSSP